MHLDILIDMKLLLCGVTSPRIAFDLEAHASLMRFNAVSPFSKSVKL